MENITVVNNELFTKLIQKVENLEVLIMDLNQKTHKEYLTHKEAQQLLKCSRNTLDKLANDGFFQRHQPNGKKTRILFKRSELQKYLQDNPKY
ncbi:helix-turn-helix domain-containing protein [Bergeyella porcorum]|uniref:helix-turn-helix domain-containing protein n=1 Tax=Bergeyella porcorum TaxID=1735111 RepID=UPI0035E865E5